MLRPAVISLFCLLTSLCVPAADPAPGLMSDQEARQTLEESPWSRPFVWSRVEGADDFYHAFQTQVSPRITVTVQLFSAHPVREAYAVQSARGNPALLKKWEWFYTQEFADEIVISWMIDCSEASSPDFRDFMAQLNTLPAAEWRKDTCLLTDTGRRVYLKDYLPPTPDGTGAKFIFPRFADDGQPLVTTDVRALEFHALPLVIASNQPTGYVLNRCQARGRDSATEAMVRDMKREQNSTLRVKVAFDLEKCRYHGQTEY
ncbi:MAG: hypothetical protein JXQ27_06000 [Acidobacteria bacterium]|nr:hypothetical protein [Acidobacteriota bacterium]